MIQPFAALTMIVWAGSGAIAVVLLAIRRPRQFAGVLETVVAAVGGIVLGPLALYSIVVEDGAER